MLHLFKLFWLFIKELIFDSKEEYDFKSKKFNAKKYMTAVLMMCSIVLNIWLLQRFYAAATENIELRKEDIAQDERLSACNVSLVELGVRLSESEDKLKECVTIKIKKK